MTPEDRDAIVGFFDRLRVLQSERDPEAEKLIHELMERHPQTKYYVTQMAFFLEHAQAEAQNRIRELEHALEQQRGGGFLGGLFGGGRTTPPPTPTHAPGYRPGMFQQPGGFLGGAAGTVTAIAGGFLLGSLLGSLLAPPAEAAAPPAEPAEEGGEEEFALDGGDESW
jgi:hypothetical protein